MHRCLAISDFNLSNLAAYLRQDPEAPAVELMEADFGQVQSVLMDPRLPAWGEADSACVWTQPDRACPAFGRLLESEPIETDELLAEVDDFASMAAAAAPRVGAMFVMTWTLRPGDRGLGMLDWSDRRGLARSIAAMNLRLADRLADQSGVFVLDTQRWVQAGGDRAHNPKLWLMSKTPFSNDVLKAAARDLKAAVRALGGAQRKLIIVDLDDTLWGGIVGEVGWEGVTLGGHDPIGEAFVEFQRALKSLTRRGIMLAIASKNEEATGLEAIRRHPEMVLREDDFVAWRINWNDKAQNIIDIVGELNLGLHSTVFLDDNPAERTRVTEALPEVLVPPLGRDPARYASLLRAMDCFDGPSVTADDRARATMYQQERQRQSERAHVGSLDDWLRSLSIKVERSPLSRENLARATQLLNKTNQMNLSTRRLTETQFMAWGSELWRRVWTFRVSDRIGEMGLTGILGVEVRGRELWIVDFVLSCRVFGRRVEEAMLATAIEYARTHHLVSVEAEYIATAKNAPCKAFFDGAGLRCDGGRYSWDAANEFPYPEQLSLVDRIDTDAAPNEVAL